MKKLIVLILVLIFTISTVNAETITLGNKNEIAKVINIVDKYEKEDGATYQLLKLKIISGKHKGKNIEAEFCLQNFENDTIKPVKKNEKVLIMQDTANEEEHKIIVIDRYRLDKILILVIIFLVLIVAIGGKQGIKTIFSLGITFLAIFGILIPGILNGQKAVVLTIIISFLISIITLLLVGGFNKKTLVSILGTISGVLIAGILVIIFGNISDITGMTTEEARLLKYATQGKSIDVEGLFFAGIILGTLGATMDITMSISSAMTEILEKAKKISIFELLKSGYTVGKDAMGTMSNTLILAYVGESLLLIILLIFNNSDYMTLLNADFLASELLRSICGTIGMISAIPFTTLIFGLFSLFHEDVIIE